MKRPADRNARPGRLRQGTHRQGRPRGRSRRCGSDHRCRSTRTNLKGNLAAGEIVKLSTRKAKSTDCICTNEVAYYPPLAKVDQFAAGVSIEAEYKGRGLGTRWSTPNSRSAYMGTFQYE